MLKVKIITRDENGLKSEHHMKWDEVCKYKEDGGFMDEEILLVFVDGVCIYSGLSSPAITLDDLSGFFG